MEYKCKLCRMIVGKYDPEQNDGDWFDESGEEELWGHIQLHHGEIFETVRCMETPDMLEHCYTEIKQ